MTHCRSTFPLDPFRFVFYGKIMPNTSAVGNYLHINDLPLPAWITAGYGFRSFELQLKEINSCTVQVASWGPQLVGQICPNHSDDFPTDYRSSEFRGYSSFSRFTKWMFLTVFAISDVLVSFRHWQMFWDTVRMNYRYVIHSQIKKTWGIVEQTYFFCSSNLPRALFWHTKTWQASSFHTYCFLR